MSVKLKLISIMSAFILILGMLFVGVYAANQNINLKGTVNFDIGDTALYVKDVRIKDPNTLSGQGTTVEGFMPGYVNTNFNLDLGTVTSSSGTFTLYIDVINTTTSRYIATTPSSISNATLSVSGTIKGDGVPITELATHENLSGTIEITVVANSTPATINLEEIEITLEELNGYNVTIINATYPSYYNRFYLFVNGEAILLETSDTLGVQGDEYTFVCSDGVVLISQSSTTSNFGNVIDTTQEYTGSIDRFAYCFYVNGLLVKASTNLTSALNIYEDCTIEITGGSTAF